MNRPDFGYNAACRLPKWIETGRTTRISGVSSPMIVFESTLNSAAIRRGSVTVRHALGHLCPLNPHIDTLISVVKLFLYVEVFKFRFVLG